jgi:ElaB/YqjD/DUF883 family membrane-anchored ribosome-binding protein
MRATRMTPRGRDNGSSALGLDGTALAPTAFSITPSLRRDGMRSPHCHRKITPMSSNHDTTADQLSSKSQFGKPSSGGRSFTEQAGRVGEEVHELGRLAVAQAGEAATHLREKGHEALEAGRERAKHVKGDFDRVVAANPMKSVLIALGVGAVLGYALRRRS